MTYPFLHPQHIVITSFLIAIKKGKSLLIVNKRLRTLFTIKKMVKKQKLFLATSILENEYLMIYKAVGFRFCKMDASGIEPEPPRCERGILPLDYAPE